MTLRLYQLLGSPTLPGYGSLASCKENSRQHVTTLRLILFPSLRMRLISELTNQLSCSQTPRPPHQLIKSVCGSQKTPPSPDPPPSTKLTNHSVCTTQMRPRPKSLRGVIQTRVKRIKLPNTKMLVCQCCGSSQSPQVL